MQLPLAGAVALSIAGLAGLVRALTWSGSLAAAALGTAVLATTGWAGGLVLAAFFVPSTIVGRLARPDPPVLPFGERRSAIQVVANGGAAMLGSLLELGAPGLGVWIVTGALAAASADTWATAVGGRSRSDPVLLGTRRRVPPGTSGGVSLAGTLGGLAGALLVAGAGALVLPHPAALGIVTFLGWGGMFFDSALGATVQGRFECPVCGIATEQPRHCGLRALRKKGWRWLDNNGVNLLTTLYGALGGGIAWRLLH